MINYDGFDLSNYLLVEDIGRPIMPPQELVTKSIYGRRGAYYLDKQDEPITIPVDVTIYEQPNMTYRQFTRFLASKLYKNEPKQLIFDDEPNVFIDAIIQGDTDLENMIEAGSGTLEFYCPDPSYYELNDEIFNLTVGKNEVVREKGNTDSFPLIEIEGTNNGGIITISTDATEINFDGDLNDGDVLTLDSDLITSYIDRNDSERVSANNDVDTMDFPVLAVGLNHIEISTEGNATVNSVRITARSRWI